MILKAFAFLDTKVGTFSAPFFFPHEGYAVRAAIECGSDLSTSIGRHPYDFTLYRLADFDDQLGSFGPAGPVAIGIVGNLLPIQPRQPVSSVPVSSDDPAVIASYRNGAGFDANQKDM